MTEAERDMEERIQAILGLMGVGYILDSISCGTLEALERGDIVRVGAPEGIEGLRALAHEYRRRLDQLRERFLRELLIERRLVGTCVARFFLSVKELLEEMVVRFEQMEIVYDEGVYRRSLRVLQEWQDEGPVCPELEPMLQRLIQQQEKELQRFMDRRKEE